MHLLSCTAGKVTVGGKQVDIAGPDYMIKVLVANFSLGGGSPSSLPTCNKRPELSGTQTATSFVPGEVPGHSCTAGHFSAPCRSLGVWNLAEPCGHPTSSQYDTAETSPRCKATKG